MDRRTWIGAAPPAGRHSAAPRIYARSSGVAGVDKRGVSGVRNPPAVISSMWIAPRELTGDRSGKRTIQRAYWKTYEGLGRPKRSVCNQYYANNCGPDLK
jgi:hypothetical protein